MEGFWEYNEDFSCELTGENDRLNLHLSTLFLELQDVYTAIYIFRVVDDEWNRKVSEKAPPEYSTVRSIIYESLVYRIILGLSKIFSDKNGYSLHKVINQIEQLYPNKKEIREVLIEIRKKLDTSKMVSIIHTFRDKFFAHLDKESAFSYFRIDPTTAMAYIDSNEIDVWLTLISELYRACFEKELPRKSQMPSTKDIIHTFFWR